MSEERTVYISRSEMPTSSLGATKLEQCNELSGLYQRICALEERLSDLCRKLKETNERVFGQTSGPDECKNQMSGLENTPVGEIYRLNDGIFGLELGLSVLAAEIDLYARAI